MNWPVFLIKIKAKFESSNVMAMLTQKLIAIFPGLGRDFIVGCNDELVIAPQPRPHEMSVPMSRHQENIFSKISVQCLELVKYACNYITISYVSTMRNFPGLYFLFLEKFVTYVAPGSFRNKKGKKYYSSISRWYNG